jgi:hypothetical protein
MLKRQRQPSPPPPSTPFLSADSFTPVPVVVEPEDSERQRHAKRRRTQPPVLDGALRGWARAETEDDGEEEVVEEEVGWSNLDENTTTTTTISEEYKSTNSILRDLHALHQHRVSFSSPTPSTRPVLPDSSTSAVLNHLSPSSKRHPVLTHPHLHAGPQMGSLHLPQSSMHKSTGQGQAQTVDEAGHYENINRYFHLFHLNFIY